MRKETRRRLLSIVLTGSLLGMLVAQNVNVKVSGQVSSKNTLTSVASLPNNKAVKRAQASLAAFLGVTTSELVAGPGFGPYVYCSYNQSGIPKGVNPIPEVCVENPDDYVIGTGENHSIKEFVELAFKVAGISDWQKHVTSEVTEHMRLAEVDLLIADSSKARKVLGWKPKYDFNALVKLMMDNEGIS